MQSVPWVFFYPQISLTRCWRGLQLRVTNRQRGKLKSLLSPAKWPGKGGIAGRPLLALPQQKKDSQGARPSICEPGHRKPASQHTPPVPGAKSGPDRSPSQPAAQTSAGPGVAAAGLGPASPEQPRGLLSPLASCTHPEEQAREGHSFSAGRTCRDGMGAS